MKMEEYAEEIYQIEKEARKSKFLEDDFFKCDIYNSLYFSCLISPLKGENK